MRFRHTLGIQIEGLGDSTAKSGGLVFAYGKLPTTGNYQWVGGLQNPPDSVDDSVNVYTGEIDNSSFNFEVANGDLASTKVFGVQAFTKLNIAAGFNAAATTLNFEGTGSTTLSGDVIYIGDEAILMGTHVGGGSYTGCVRGYWSTEATALRSKDFAYLRPPYIVQRKILLIKHDRETGVDTIIWRGFVDDVETSNDGKTINILTLSLISAIRDAVINRGSPKIRTTGYIVDDGLSEPFLYARTPGFQRRVNKGASSSTIYMQVADTLILTTWISATVGINFEDEPAFWWGAPALEDPARRLPNGSFVTPDGEPAPQYSEVAYEVFAVDKYTSTSSSRDLTYPLHPVAITMGFLLSGRSEFSISGYDVFGREWGLGLDSAYFDLSGINQLILDTRGIEIDRLLLGWDGEEVSIFDVVTSKLLRPYGFSWSITQSGLISVTYTAPTSLGDGIASQATPVNPVPPTLGWRLAREGQVQQAVATIGELPWREPDRIILQARDGIRRDNARRILFTEKSSDYDFSTLDPQSDRAQVLTKLLGLIVQSRTAAPVITILVGNTETTGVTYDLGQQITIAAPTMRAAWAVDSDGVRVFIDPDEPAWTGQIISRRHDLVRDVYVLDILLTNWAKNRFIQWRAPSAVVVSVAGGAFTVTAAAFTTDDTSFFPVGQKFTVWSAAGVRRGASSNIGTVTSVASGTINYSGGDWSAVVAGDIIRVASYDVAVGASAPIPGYSGRVWSYFAQAGLLGSDDPDIWG